MDECQACRCFIFFWFLLWLFLFAAPAVIRSGGGGVVGGAVIAEDWAECCVIGPDERPKEGCSGGEGGVLVTRWRGGSEANAEAAFTPPDGGCACLEKWGGLCDELPTLYEFYEMSSDFVGLAGCQ